MLRTSSNSQEYIQFTERPDASTDCPENVGSSVSSTAIDGAVGTNYWRNYRVAVLACR